MFYRMTQLIQINSGGLLKKNNGYKSLQINSGSSGSNVTLEKVKKKKTLLELIKDWFK